VLTHNQQRIKRSRAAIGRP